MKVSQKLRICKNVIINGKMPAVGYLFCRLLSGLVFPLTAYAFQILIDEIIHTYQMKGGIIELIIPLYGVGGLYFFQAIEEPIGSYCSFLVSQRMNVVYNETILNKLINIEYPYYENSDTLDLMKRVEEKSGQIAWELFCNFCELLSGIIRIIGTFLVLMYYSVWVALLSAIVLIPVLWIATKYGKAIHQWYQENSKDRRFLGYLSSIFVDRNTALEIRTYDFYSYFEKKWKEQSSDLIRKDFFLQLKSWKNTIVSSFVLNLFEYLTYGIMLLPTIRGTITIGSFIGLSKAISGIESLVLWNFSSLFTQLKRNEEEWKDYKQFMELEEISKGKNVVNEKKTAVAIEFQHVSFKYPNMKNDILVDVSFCINHNELCGLVGINGAGKSTITKLLLGLYKPSSGDILLNGKNTKEMTFEEQVQYFGVTYQDFSRFNISIRENIELGQENLKQKKIEEYLVLLELNYKKLPKQIDTVVGRLFGEGLELSEGEWQKVAIARMLYKEPMFFVMDEPTASLDPISEVNLYKKMQALLSGKTGMLITHRLGATTICDRILVLSEGRIIESGKFAELMQRRGSYAKMYEEQKKWYE